MNNKTIVKKEKRDRRHKRIRSRVFGTAEKPRISVFKSNKDIYVQLIDDASSKTLCESNSKKVSGKTLSEKAVSVGKEIASKAKALNISKAVFDRGGFMYTGSIKSVAEGARLGGLIF